MIGKREYDIEKELREWFRGAQRVVIVGLGNPIRMDDFVGVKVVRDLVGKVNSEKVVLVEAETLPENHTQQILGFKPTHILMVDAAEFGSRPGETRLIEPEWLPDIPAFSTHMLPLRVFCEYMVRTTKAKLGLLLIEPHETSFGEKLSPEVVASAARIACLLCAVLSQFT